MYALQSLTLTELITVQDWLVLLLAALLRRVACTLACQLQTGMKAASRQSGMPQPE